MQWLRVKVDGVKHISMEEIRSPRGGIVFDESTGTYVLPRARRGSGAQFDWGSGFARGERDRSVVVVEFKNGRREYYLNAALLALTSGDLVCVGGASGYDVGVVSLAGWLAYRSYQRWRGEREHALCPVLRRANRGDVDRWVACTAREHDSMLLARSMALDLGLQMKVVDVEFQGDGSRAAFYYSAEKRVDFRELVRALAGELHVRVEMRQIGPRQESGLIGGLGTCGQPICCKQWLRSYLPVTTGTVKMQDMTPNPQKQAGQCGKLKCCLNFEVDHYAEAKKLFPRIKSPLQLEDMQLYHVKNDLFRHQMWFSTGPRGAGQQVMLSLGQVEEILVLNAEGKPAAPLSKLTPPSAQPVKPQVGYENVIEEESITRFDQQKRSKSRREAKRGKQPVAASRQTDSESKHATPKQAPTPNAPKRANPSAAVQILRGERAQRGNSGARSAQGNATQQPEKGLPRPAEGRRPAPRSAPTPPAAPTSPVSPAQRPQGGVQTAHRAPRSPLHRSRNPKGGAAVRRADNPKQELG